nr:dihydropteroate synthase [Auraticoccus cholistanensis]
MVEPVSVAPVRRIGRRTFDFNARVAVMAIVNRTRDSFFDRGRTFPLQAAVEACLAAAEAGADMVDVGGVPFSPDAEPVSAAEELDRVLPLVTEVVRHSDVVLSVDTTRAAVAEAVVGAGAGIINDTSGLHDPRTAEVAAATGAQLVVTHSLAAPGRHLAAPPTYVDVVAEVADHLTTVADRARAAGVPDGQLLLDPGPDLNKNTRHTLQLVAGFDRFTRAGLPTLVAVSNKDFVGEVLDREKSGRLAGTLAATVACVLAGGRVVRAHDVAATVDAVRMTEAVMGLREPVRMVHNAG